MEIKEWLNEDNTLGIDIWEQKYRYNNETFDEFLDRVSAGDPDLRQLIVDKKFLFGGRILANRGIEAKGKTYSNCFLAGTKVLTKDGYKNIEEIQCGELVYTHTGKWNKVNKLLVRKYVGSIYKIQSNNLLSPIFCTPNHKFLTSSGEWKAIENFVIQSGKTTKIDRLVSPNEMIYHEWTDLNIDITSDFVCPVNRRLYYKDNAVGIEEFINDRGSDIWRKPRNLITRNFVLDEEMLYLIGRWIGDGSITTRKEKTNPSIWQIVFNTQNERDAFDVCYKILKSHFPTINITTRETNQNILALRVENELFATWFKNNFGQGCSGKYIPKWIGYPRNLLLGLLDADGSVHSQGDFKLLLKNPELIRWARQALFNLGICVNSIKSETRQVADYFSIIKNQSRKLIPNLNKKYSDDRMLVNLNLDCSSVKIDSIEILENYNTLVYNLSVENDHSYLVNGVFAHNCYVLPSIEDSIESIYETCGMLARTFSYGGGCGVDISKLRPSGAKVNNSAKTTTGAVSFMQTLSMVAETIGQRSRRGATMISISVNHPDVEEFINCKTDLNKVTGANISVRVTDEFMKAVENDEDYILRWPCTENQNVQLDEYNKLYETPFGYAKKVKAKELFNKLVYNNWDYAEPGILYWDRISKWNIVSEDPNFEYAGTNPCAKLIIYLSK